MTCCQVNNDNNEANENIINWVRINSCRRCFHVFTPRTGVTHNPASVWETRVYVQPKVHEDATPAIDGDRRRSVGLILNLRDLHFRS